MSLTDTHAHLCDPAFDEDLDQVLSAASAAGVGAIVAVGETLSDARRNLEIADAYPDLVRPAAGLFPTILDREQAGQVTDFMRAQRRRWVAVGEVGLDHWKVQDEPGREVQREIFVGFIRLAADLDQPLNVHSRSAGRATIDVLLAEGARRVQMHAFDGRAAKAQAGLEAGFFFSVPPSIVRSAQKQKLVRQLPLSCLLLETDSPVLGPEPDRRNEPRNLLTALSLICEIKEQSEAVVREAIAGNTRRLYGFP